MSNTARSQERSGLDLTAEEHLEAEELIGELQDRMYELRNRNDKHVKKARRRGYASNYEPDTYTIKFGESIIVIKDGQGRVSVSHNGKDVVRVFGMNLDLINLDGLNRSMAGIRQYMVLDDLASI
jgi:hypothetical protein